MRYRFKFFDGQIFEASGNTPRDALRALGLQAYNPVAYGVTEIADEGLVMMSVEEFEKLYADVELTFASYYKYVFNFEGIAPDGVRIIAELGGDIDDIYREEIDNNQKRKVGAPEKNWFRMQAWRGDDLIFDHNEY